MFALSQLLRLLESCGLLCQRIRLPRALRDGTDWNAVTCCVAGWTFDRLRVWIDPLNVGIPAHTGSASMPTPVPKDCPSQSVRKQAGAALHPEAQTALLVHSACEQTASSSVRSPDYSGKQRVRENGEERTKNPRRCSDDLCCVVMGCPVDPLCQDQIILSRIHVGFSAQNTVVAVQANKPSKD